uniref:hypothetical protein n=1 Tax=Agathobacter rectalis TaxID=39491 RepID=UPI0040262D13
TQNMASPAVSPDNITDSAQVEQPEITQVVTQAEIPAEQQVEIPEITPVVIQVETPGTAQVELPVAPPEAEQPSRFFRTLVQQNNFNTSKVILCILN